MARLLATLVTARETFTLEAFKAVPPPSIKEVQSMLRNSVELGQKEMGPNRIYEIRKAALEGKEMPAKVSKKKVEVVVDVTSEESPAVETIPDNGMTAGSVLVAASEGSIVTAAAAYYAVDAAPVLHETAEDMPQPATIEP